MASLRNSAVTMPHPAGYACGMNVLIIEDSLTTAMMLENFVSACGHQPISVPSAWLACSAAEEWPIDLVLLDIMLPGMDGYQLAARLRWQGVRVPIIAVTSLEDDPVKREEYGIDGYVGKPVSMTQLKDLLEE
jgi:DNA-binding response OmpR family regulator